MLSRYMHGNIYYIRCLFGTRQENYANTYKIKVTFNDLKQNAFLLNIEYNFNWKFVYSRQYAM